MIEQTQGRSTYIVVGPIASDRTKSHVLQLIGRNFIPVLSENIGKLAACQRIGEIFRVCRPLRRPPRIRPIPFHCSVEIIPISHTTALILAPNETLEASERATIAYVVHDEIPRQ